MLTWLVDALRAEGLTVHPVKGWRTRGVDAPLNQGVMFHHTASPRGSGNAPSLGIVTHGRPDVPGPLANVLVGRNGEVWVVAAGKANHAGLGGPWRTVPQNSGNSHIVGVEVENDGVGEPWTERVLGACDRVFAAALKRQRKDASWCIGHYEWTTRKTDPALNGPRRGMGAYRRRLADYMGGDDVKFEQFYDGYTFAKKHPNAKRPKGKGKFFNLGFHMRRMDERGLQKPKPPAPAPAPAEPHNHPHDHPVEITVVGKTRESS